MVYSFLDSVFYACVCDLRLILMSVDKEYAKMVKSLFHAFALRGVALLANWFYGCMHYWLKSKDAYGCKIPNI